jgi:protein-disulfide isomerase
MSMAKPKERIVKKGIVIKFPKINVWIVSTMILVVVLAFVLFKGTKITGMAPSVVLDRDEAAQKAIDYINNNLIQPGTTISLVSVEELSGVYKVNTEYQSQEIPVYITKDGSYLFISQPLNTSIEIPKQEEQVFDAPNKDKPEVELFVMAFCPYGVQAENLMKNVVDLLGTKVDFKVRFITSIQGNTPDSIGSLHGSNEANEDLRQVCIMKYYDQKTYWNYLMEIDTNCYPIYSDVARLDTCWKAAAEKLKIDTAKIEGCSQSSEGVDLLKADDQLTQTYGVTGSPTLVINGDVYSGARTSEAFKQAICSGFTTQPDECSSDLSEGTETASGSCG